METKRCSQCGEVKLSKEFYIDLSRKTKLSSQCKVCLKFKSTDYREKYPEKVKESKKRCYQNNQGYYYKKSREWAMANRIKAREYSLKWWHKNPDRWKVASVKKIQYLYPCYLKDLLKREGILGEVITPELMQLKREQLTALRLYIRARKEIYHEERLVSGF
jgi:hypothetical protein